MELDKKQKKLKGIYIIPDHKMLKPNFGPSEHIKVGLKELKKYFEIELLVLNEYNELNEEFNNKSITRNVGLENGIIGLFRDLKLLYLSNIKGKILYDRIKQLGEIDFIYERGQYLDFRGINISSKLGIPHFYEVNWLNFLGIKQFYTSWFNYFAQKLEENAYHKSTLNFFVGTQHKLIKISNEKVYTIQNGIEEELIQRFSDHKNKIDTKIKICYVANLMPHHRFDILIGALNKCNNLNKIELHLIGYYFENYKEKLPENLEVFYHGAIQKFKLPELLKSFNVGIVSGGPSYSSFMKIFEYAAFKMCVIAPDIDNLINIFSPNEILFFKTNKVDSLANAIETICSNKDQLCKYGENLFEKVKYKYTWELIYEDIAKQIACRV